MLRKYNLQYVLVDEQGRHSFGVMGLKPPKNLQQIFLDYSWSEAQILQSKWCPWILYKVLLHKFSTFHLDCHNFDSSIAPLFTFVTHSSIIASLLLSFVYDFFEQISKFLADSVMVVICFKGYFFKLETLIFRIFYKLIFKKTLLSAQKLRRKDLYECNK